MRLRSARRAIAHARISTGDAVRQSGNGEQTGVRLRAAICGVERRELEHVFELHACSFPQMWKTLWKTWVQRMDKCSSYPHGYAQSLQFQWFLLWNIVDNVIHNGQWEVWAI